MHRRVVLTGGRHHRVTQSLEDRVTDETDDEPDADQAQADGIQDFFHADPPFRVGCDELLHLYYITKYTKNQVLWVNSKQAKHR